MPTPNYRGTKAEFLKDSQVTSFSDWLAGVICGTVIIDYTAAPDIQFRTLAEAKKAYRWPVKKTDIPTPIGKVTLPRGSGLKENEDVLRRLSTGVRSALNACPRNEGALAAWIKAIFMWGGVYTKRGNARWLATMHGRLCPYLARTLKVLGGVQESGIDTLSDLRSNAGTTKVHSLVLSNFIIYDSRVAAALAWLVVKWACATDLNAVPTRLRFGCMRANAAEGKKRRTPNERIFPYFAPVASNLNSQRTHALWNLRANWLLRKSLDQAKRDCGTKSDFRSLRDVEAALFVMGANLSHAMPAFQTCLGALAGRTSPQRKITTWRVEELTPPLGGAITQEDLEREVDNRMIGNHDLWSPPDSEK